MVIGHPAAHSAERHARVDAAHVNARGQRPRAAAMIVRDQRERGGDVARLADPHERAGPDKLLIRLRKRRGPRDERPHAEADENDATAAEAIRAPAAHRTQHAIDEEEDHRECAEIIVTHRDRRFDRIPHRGEHDAVEVIQAAHDPEQCDHEPGPRERTQIDSIAAGSGGRRHGRKNYITSFKAGAASPSRGGGCAGGSALRLCCHPRSSRAALRRR